MGKIITFYMSRSNKIGIGLTIIIIGLNVILDINVPFIWLLGISALLFIILNIPTFNMYLGLLYVNIKYGSKQPSKENYTCKVDYILPIAGKWTITSGGVEKNYLILGKQSANDMLMILL